MIEWVRMMPRNVRNFWVRCGIDGRNTLMEGGPVRKNGGLSMIIFQRYDGSPVVGASVQCYEDDDNLHLVVYDSGGEEVYKHTTQR